MFEKKATAEEVAHLRGIVGKHSEELRNLYGALVNQKQMIDKLMDYFGIEPVTTITKIGAGYPTTKTETTFKKKTKKPVKSEDPEGYDD